MKDCNAPKPIKDGVLHDAAGLEFPDWSGMKSHRSRKTLEEAARWNEEMLALFSPRKRPQKLEAERRCYAEFVL